MYLVPALDFADAETGVAPVNTVAPVVSGTTVVGQVLSCTTGTWAGDPTITYSYQWKRGVSNVGTNSSNYTLVSGDISSNMSCVVTATNGVGSTSQSSNSVGPVLADIRASVGTSTSPTSTGTKAVTGVGFQPKGILDFGCGIAAAGAAPQLYYGLGAGVSTSSRAAVGVSSTDSVTTTVTSRRHDNAKMALVYGIGGIRLDANLSSMDADGFTRNWSTVNATAFIQNHIALGGSDLEVSLVQCQMNGTNAAQSFAHGLSGAPTGVLFFSINETTAPPFTQTSLRLSMGAWASSGQFAASTFSDNGVTTTATRRLLATDCSLATLTTTVDRKLAVSSVDSTNVNVSYPITVSGSQRYFYMLVIRGAKCQVGTFNTASSNTITTTGITPKLFLPVFVPTGISNIGTVQNHLMLTIGASDGTTSVSCGITDENGVTTTNTRRYQSSTSLCEYYRNGAKAFEATAAFIGESVVVTPTQADFQYGQAGYLVIGN